MKRAGFALTFAAAFVLTLPLAFAQAEDPNAYGDDYRQGDYGRVRYTESGVTIVRAQSNDPGQPGNASATVNAPVFPGDTVRTAGGQRVEIQLAGGTLIRQDDNGEMTYLSLPRPGAAYQDNTVLRLASGAVRVISRIGDKASFRIDTPAASVYLLDDGDVRVDVDGSGSTRVLSHRGVVEVVGGDGSVLVRGGMRTSVDPGSVPSEPRAFNTFASDAFDRFCDQRDDAYRVRDRYAGSAGNNSSEAYDAVPNEVRPYYGELSANGRWVNAPDYGWVWYPYDVAPGWRPYSDGYWDYGPGGYFWVGNEPWGWAPYHYGRWSWTIGFGWGWAPGRVFGGAWVAWSWGSAYVGWAPLDYWGSPAYYGSPWYGYYDPHCWTFVGYDHFHGHDYGHYAVPLDRVGHDLQNTPVVTRPPRIPPGRLARDPSSRETAARDASRDRGARLRPIVKGRTPDTRFRSMEDRMIERSRATPKPGAPTDTRTATPGLRRSGAVPGLPAAGAAGGRDATGRPRVLGQGGEGSSGPAIGTAGSTVERDRTPRNGQPEPERWQRSRRTESQQPTTGISERSAGRSGSGEGGYPRRILSDPRADERGRQGDSPGAGRESGRSYRTPEAPARVAPREERGRDTRERVRDMYQQLARPRETDRRESVREVRPATPAPERRETRAPRVERAAPPSRQAPRVERSQPQAPTAPRGGGQAGHAPPKERGKK